MFPPVFSSTSSFHHTQQLCARGKNRCSKNTALLCNESARKYHNGCNFCLVCASVQFKLSRASLRFRDNNLRILRPPCLMEYSNVRVIMLWKGSPLAPPPYAGLVSPPPPAVRPCVEIAYICSLKAPAFCNGQLGCFSMTMGSPCGVESQMFMCSMILIAACLMITVMTWRRLRLTENCKS